MLITYDLAGGLYHSGKVRFSYDDVESVGPFYGDIRVTLHNGRTYIVSGRYQKLLKLL
jgi:hypothetical protein